MSELARNTKIEKLWAFPDGTPVGTHGRVDKIDTRLGLFSVNWEDGEFSIEDRNERDSTWKIVKED